MTLDGYLVQHPMNEGDASDDLMLRDANHTLGKKNVAKQLSSMNVTGKPSLSSYTTEKVFRPQLLTKRDNVQSPPKSGAVTSAITSNLGKTLHSPRFQWINKP